MSGEGVISVRLPKSLLRLFRAIVKQRGMTPHEAARGLLDALASLTQEGLRSLKEPPHELENPRTSLYLGWRRIDVLCAATRNSTLTNSSIFRRLLYGLLVSKQIEFVQHGTQTKLQFVRTQVNENTLSDRALK
jgi:hypothetical protein